MSDTAPVIQSRHVPNGVFYLQDNEQEVLFTYRPYDSRDVASVELEARYLFLARGQLYIDLVTFGQVAGRFRRY